MRVCTKCGETKDESCFYKQAGGRGGLHPYCKTCVLAAQKAYRQANKDSVSARSKKYREENRDKIAAKDKAYYQRNLEENRAKRRAYYEANKERMIAKANQWNKENREKRLSTLTQYRKNNQHVIQAEYERNKYRYVENAARRRVKIKEVTPTWSDADVVAEYYKAVQALNKFMPNHTFHVDHVVPLQSDLVCGLHSSTNLQVLFDKENLSKRNLVWPNMPLTLVI